MLEDIHSVLVVGLGRSGHEAALLLHKLGASVTALDDKGSKAVTRRAGILTNRGIPVLLGRHPDSLLQDKDLIVVSPAVHPDHPLLVRAGACGIPVWSELEFASRFVEPEAICAITGTNGKTTTTLLTYRMLRAGLPSTRVGGNIGVPLSRLVRQANRSILSSPVILEVSSFQLELTTTFHPHIYGVLNLAVDHLDWHPSFPAYVRAKTLPLTRMTPGDTVLLNHDDQQVRAMAALTKAKVIYFSEKSPLSSGLYKCGNQLVAQLDKTYTIDLGDLSVAQFHSWQNVLCAVATALLRRVPIETITHVLHSYRPLAHRQQIVALVGGVTFVDDSKATNPDAVKTFLSTLKQPGVLIMGGKDKGGDFSVLAPYLAANIHHIITIGQTREQIARQLGNTVEVTVRSTVSEAVQAAFRIARAGDIIALSPGCSSFDQFSSYKHRGRVFCEQVMGLASGNERD